MIAALLHPLPGASGARLGGMTILERQLFLLARAGFRTVWLGDAPAGALQRGPDGVELLPGRPPAAARCLEISGAILLRQAAIRRVALAAEAAPARFEDASGAAAAWTSDQQAPPRGACSCRGDKGCSTEHSAAGAAAPVRLAPGDAAAIGTAPEREAAQAWLLEGVRKSTDGFMARVFDRRISLAVTARLLDTRIRPNHMTILSVALGLAGAGLFAIPGRGFEIAGALLVWLHTVLDGCDGELARLTFRESSWGAQLDFWGDNLVHVALFFCMALDLARQNPAAPALGALAAAGSLGSAWLAWLASRGRAGAPAGGMMSGVADLPTLGSAVAERLKRMEVVLAQRDFIYLLVALTLVDKDQWFLIAAGVGAPLYLTIMAFLVWRAGEVGPAPREGWMERKLDPRPSMSAVGGRK